MNRHPLSHRVHLRPLAAAVSLAVLIISSLGGFARQPIPSANAAGTLNVLTWEGYADAQWVKPFQKRYHVKLNITYIGSDDELFAKIRGGQGLTYDVMATNRANLPALKASNLIIPLDESEVPNYHNVIPQLKDKGYRLGGRLYAVPFLWGANVLLYNPRYVPTRPTSWNVLWDEKYRGKITLPDDSTLSTSFAALALGYKDPFHLTDAQLNAVKVKLMAQRPLLRTLFTGFQDDANLFASSNVVVGVSEGSYVVKLAAQKGVKLIETVPKEGAISWLDTWAITKGGAQKGSLPYAWLNYMISKNVQKMAIEANYYPGTMQGVANLLNPRLVKAIHMTDPGFLTRLIPQVLPENLQKRQKIWNEVKAG